MGTNRVVQNRPLPLAVFQLIEAQPARTSLKGIEIAYFRVWYTEWHVEQIVVHINTTVSSMSVKVALEMRNQYIQLYFISLLFSKHSVGL
jgi:hypothetical protein